jgi:threonine dehydrogenase-like Zn-dependent dehydrogenase
MTGEGARIHLISAGRMLSLPEHSVVLRLPNQNCLTVKRSSTRSVDDSSIVIKMLAAGVCGTDLAILSGARTGHAKILGHEGVGVVVHAPKDFRAPEGARLIISPVHCKKPHIVIGHSCDGVFREWFCIDAADADEGRFLVPCPRECALEDIELALAEPVASALYSVELLREKCGTASLLIRGSGTIAILAAKLWSSIAESTAIVVSKSEGHAQWLRESTPWPANVRICSSAALPGTIREHGIGSDLRAGVLCCSREGAPEGLGLLLDFLKEGATIDLMAGFPTEYREPRLGGVALDAIRWNNVCGVTSATAKAVLDRSSGKNFFLTGHRGTAERHILNAIDLLSRRSISIADVPHRRFTLEELPGAVNRMLTSQTRHHTKWVKACVAFSQDRDGERIGDS